MEPCNMEQRITALERDSERNQHTHKEFYDKFEGLTTRQAVLDEKFSQIMSGIGDLQKDMKEIKEKPAKRWDAVVSTVLQWAVLLLLGVLTLKGA